MTSLTLMMNTTAGQGDKRIVSRYELLILYSGENLPANRMDVRTGCRPGPAWRCSRGLVWRGPVREFMPGSRPGSTGL